MNIAVVTMMITMEMLVMNNTMKMTMTMPMMQMRMVMLMMMLMVMMMMMMMMMIIPAHRQLHYSSVHPTRAVERSPSLRLMAWARDHDAAQTVPAITPHSVWQ